ncbi:DUF29 domain-containing protein [Elstera cyanobacteriorum]|uniref:DUF29 domain-containing protein n=1 Tax=Elstera cyanobacteriorum TaxID=2022747 RepID=UPI0023559A5F|nr:DUF29 domain-containing protein [Elstera cyanobacteriorum]MCK6442152.1 DUF29 domain-containing protein [Elstera cyanobacteriorum]
MSLYESDFYAWTRQQATLLRDGKLAQADIEKIAEEIDSMGWGEQRELENRLTVLMLHLLKWRYQPALRGNSWRYSVMEQRRRIERHLRQNPSLRAKLPETILDAYGDALIEAARETGLDPSGFPQTCPWAFDDMMAPTFWPEA